jgi:hypothetical protein
VVVIAIGAFAIVLVAAWRFSRGISRRLFPLHRPRLLELLPPAPLALGERLGEIEGRAIELTNKVSRLLPGACRSCGWVDRRECAPEVAVHGRCSNAAAHRRPVEMPTPGPGKTRRG